MTVNVLQGDALQVLTTLPEKHFHCVVTSPPYWGLRAYLPADAPDKAHEIGTEPAADCLGWARGDAPCGKCYVCKLRLVAMALHRVLRDDGVFFLNLGDSYNGSGGSGGDYAAGGLKEGQPRYPGRRVANLKPKDLCGIPWRCALALQADGWWLRSEIVWAKDAPMPESVTDRPTRAHEQIFLLTKSARYFWDAEAVKEAALQPLGAPKLTAQVKADAGGFTTNGHGNSTLGTNQGASSRNLRDVWRLSPSPYPEAHFATFVPEIPRRAILSGTSERGCCPTCGAPWERVVEKPDMTDRPRRSEDAKYQQNEWTGVTSAGQAYQEWRNANPNVTTGWTPGCNCGADYTVPCRVLDPFGGSGTTGQVATELGRDCTLIELNPAYVKLIEQRVSNAQPGLQFAQHEEVNA